MWTPTVEVSRATLYLRRSVCWNARARETRGEIRTWQRNIPEGEEHAEPHVRARSMRFAMNLRQVRHERCVWAGYAAMFFSALFRLGFSAVLRDFGWHLHHAVEKFAHYQEPRSVGKGRRQTQQTGHQVTVEHYFLTAEYVGHATPEKGRADHSWNKLTRQPTRFLISFPHCKSKMRSNCDSKRAQNWTCVIASMGNERERSLKFAHCFPAEACYRSRWWRLSLQPNRAAVL